MQNLRLSISYAFCAVFECTIRISILDSRFSKPHDRCKLEHKERANGEFHLSMAMARVLDLDTQTWTWTQNKLSRQHQAKATLIDYDPNTLLIQASVFLA